jgi:hypothetical protein
LRVPRQIDEVLGSAFARMIRPSAAVAEEIEVFIGFDQPAYFSSSARQR